MGTTSPRPAFDATEIEAALVALDDLVVIDPAAAVDKAGGLLAVVDAMGSMADRLRLRRLLAMSCAHSNDFDRALATCAEAEALPGADAAPVELARVRLAAMQPLAITGQIEAAIVAGEGALTLLEASDQPDLAGRAALNLGSIHAMTGHAATALPWFDRAARHLADHALLMGQIESNRGTALAALDRFEESQQAFERAVTLLDAEEHSWAIAIAEGNLADLAARQGELNGALRYFERSRRRLEQDEDWGDLGRINAEEAALLAVMGMANLARDRFSAAIALLDDHGAPVDAAVARVAFAHTLADLDEVEDAERHLAAAAELIDPEDHHDVYLRMLGLRARVALTQGDLEGAERHVEAGLQATADLPVQRVRWIILQAAVERQRGEIQAARQRLLDARRTAQRLPPVLADLETELAELARAAGDPDSGAVHARRAVEASETIRGTIHGDRLRQAWHRGRLGIYERHYLALLVEPDAVSQQEAFGIAERIRNRSLLDRMGSEAVVNRLPVSASEASLIADLEGHRRWLNWMYSALADGQEPDAARLAELAERERAVGDLADRLAVLRPGPGLQRPHSLGDVRDRLVDPSTALISYLVVGDYLTAQVVTEHEARGFARLAPVATIRQLVGELQFQIDRALAHGRTSPTSARRDRLQRDVDAVLEALYATIMAPLEPHLSSLERLIVAPAGDLHGVPFAALRHGGAYLLDARSLVVAPGFSVLATMPRLAMATITGHPMVVGVPDALAPDLGAEAELVAGRFPAATRLVAAGASKQKVLETLPDASLVHLATHGRFDTAHPGASGLRLTDGWLTLDDLGRVVLERPLVVLTGCETGRVQVQEGDDLEGLMAALIAAGAAGLVASLWKTHDTAATALIGAFYDELVDTVDPATALRSAQQAVRNTFPHPAFWAPFVAVHGDQKGA